MSGWAAAAQIVLGAAANNEAKKDAKEAAKPSHLERAQAGIAAEQWSDYRQRYVPIENDFIEKIRATESRKGAEKGRAGATVQQGLSGGTRKALANRGKAGGGRGLMRALNANMTKGSALGDANNQAVLTAESREQGGLTRMASYGRGLSDQHDVGLASAADRSSRASIERSVNRYQSTQDTASGVGAAFGMAGDHYGWFDSGDESKSEYKKDPGGKE